MAKATILIPDISGYTEFLTKTEIEHSSHIINELLEVLIKTQNLGFHLSEVEGDALLYYKIGDPPPSAPALVDLCLRMYENFHWQLKMIGRDSICKCGACTGAAELSLKFIGHFGDLHEIKVSNFLKGTGADMIVAHRLLKNKIERHEYLLLSQKYLDAAGVEPPAKNLNWKTDEEEYSSIGKVPFQFATLENIKVTLPPTPEKEKPAHINPRHTLEVDIEAPMLHTYQTLIDTNLRMVWVNGMSKMDWKPTAERVGTQHVCYTSGWELEHTAAGAEFGEDEIEYLEKVRVRKSGVEVYDIYKVKKTGERRCRLSLNLSFIKKRWYNGFVFRLLAPHLRKDLACLKKLCEENFQKTTGTENMKGE